VALSNIDQISRGLDLLAEGLEPFIARVLAPHVPQGQDWTWLLASRDAVNGVTGKTYSRTDPQNQLRVLTERLGSLGFPFGPQLSRAEQNLAGELRGVRDTWAHRGSFSPDDAYRALDTMERLLRAAGAVTQADQVKVIRLDVQRAAYENETRRTARTYSATPDTADDELPAWRDVVRPHTDVQAGTFAASEFAADLYRVALGADEVEAEYIDPIEFFRRTHLTGGLRDLLVRSAKRIGGDANADPVINLQDRFGGGKTHSMLAVWHLFSGRPLGDLPQEVQDLLMSVDPTGHTVRRVALVGNEIAPGQPTTKPDGTVVRTLWGELAWQLGGPDAYATIAESDQTGTNPGATLRDLLTRHAPAVILIDEWVAYARQLYGREDLSAGTFETQFTFAQSLTQAVAAVPGALLLVSIPASDTRAQQDPAAVDVTASDLEVGGEYGRLALDRLNHVVRRVAYAWEPATPDESFEIVRRRLFHEPDNAATAQINAVARRFAEHYRHHGTELPSGVTERAYENRIRTAYPIHPELLDRLYSEWSTLERFQRTRGVLRLMSTVVHQLWERGDKSPLILPGAVPLDTGGARGEVVQYVDPRWAEIVETDVDGENSVARRIDTDRPLLGRRSLSLRVARTVFLDSAPTLDAAHKGVDRKRIALGVVMPGDVIGNIGSALDALLNSSSYLFREGDRYWYDTQPSLNRLAAERARELPLEKVKTEVVRRLGVAARGPHPDFAGVVVAPESSADVPDDEGTRLVVLRPEHRHNGKDKESTAARFTLDLLQHRGSGPRLRPNSIVALGADEARWKDLETTVRQHLAWRSIADDTSLDLTQSNAAQARKRTEETNRTIEDQILTTWIWGLHAVQDRADQPLTVGQVKCDGGDKSLAVRVGKKLVSAGALRVQLGPAALWVDLTHYLRARWNTGHVSVGELWDWFSRYPYLVRLRDRRVLTDAVYDVLHDPAWAQKGFALATGVDRATGDFTGLAVPLEDLEFGVVDDATLLVRPDLATEQRRREQEAAAVSAGTSAGGEPADPPSATAPSGSSSGDGHSTSAPKPAAKRANVRWTGRFDIDPESDVEVTLATIAREVLAALHQADPELLEISLDVTAERYEGFESDIVRTVTENSRTLGASKARFEDA
jgi:predicted AAA+ superfamily ATPase